MRLVIATLVMLASIAPAPAAAAADLSLSVVPREGSVLGEGTRLTGALTQDGRPAAGQVLELKARPYPYDGAFRVLGRTATDDRGRYTLVQRFERNHQVRISTPPVPGALTASSRVARAYVFPSARISARTLRHNVVRITQTLTVPRDVVLRAPSRFYLGRARARTAGFVKSAHPRRLRAGRYRVRVTVRVPAAYRGRFSYAACFEPTRGSGLGDPGARCPARYEF